MLQDVNKKYVFENIENKKGVYLLVFHALWCGPCRMFKESLTELNEKEGIEVLRVNIDEEQELASEFKVKSIPTWFIFKDGKIVEQAMGYLPYSELKKKVSKYL